MSSSLNAATCEVVQIIDATTKSGIPRTLRFTVASPITEDEALDRVRAGKFVKFVPGAMQAESEGPAGDGAWIIRVSLNPNLAGLISTLKQCGIRNVESVLVVPGNGTIN